jgi:hypothetical protein
MRHRLGIALGLLIAVALLAGGCGYGDDDEDEPTSPPPAQATPPVPEPDPATGSLPVEEFNGFVEQARPAFASSALRTAIEFSNAGEGQAAKTSVIASQGAEGNSDEASVTVTREGLADDSVRAVRYVLVLDRNGDGTWRLRTAKRLQQCHQNRGHQEFSPRLCS